MIMQDHAPRIRGRERRIWNTAKAAAAILAVILLASFLIGG